MSNKFLAELDAFFKKLSRADHKLHGSIWTWWKYGKRLLYAHESKYTQWYLSMCNSNKFVLLFISQDIWVDSVTWDKGFVLRGIGDAKVFLIISRLFSF